MREAREERINARIVEMREELEAEQRTRAAIEQRERASALKCESLEAELSEMSRRAEAEQRADAHRGRGAQAERHHEKQGDQLAQAGVRRQPLAAHGAREDRHPLERPPLQREHERAREPQSQVASHLAPLRGLRPAQSPCTAATAAAAAAAFA